MQNDSHDLRDDTQLPEQAQIEVRRMRERGPGDQALRRLRGNLGVPDPSGASGQGSGEAAGATGEAAGPTVPSAASFSVAKVVALAGLVATLGGLWWGVRHSKHSSVPAASVSIAVSCASLPPVLAVVTETVVEGVAIASAVAQAEPAPSSLASPGVRESKGESEVQLIARAQGLVRSRPASALALCREHARRFPKGMLGQEREVLIVEALHLMGRDAEASKQSKSFLERNPDTALRDKVEHLTGDASPEK